MRNKLSIIVPTGNRKSIIRGCLESVRWADELIVVGSFTTDGTLEIAREYADRLLQHEYVNSAEQKNWAIPQASHDWVMIVDTDERITPALRNEVERILADPGDFAGFLVPRENYMFGSIIRSAGYFPDFQLRLFKRDLGRYDLRKVHAHVELDGLCGKISSPIVHFANRSLDQMITNLIVQMTTWEAEERELQSLRAGKNPLRYLVINLTFRPVAAFFARYFRQGGWREGINGLIVSLIWAIYVCVSYMKIYERSLDLQDNWWEEIKFPGA